MAVIASASITLTAVVDVRSVTRYYKLQSSTLAKPTKPAAKPPSGWTATEPAYAEGATNSLYTCELTTFSDGSWAYSDVSLSSSYEAAKKAYNEAAAAGQAAADALNKTHYGACNTAQATAAKATASNIAGFSLVAGASVRIKFTYANTAASPTLNVNGTGAKQIRLNGANSAYWVAGATVDFVFDGAYWQVCSTPLYGATATIGNPTGGNVYVDGDGVSVRRGDAVLARLSAGAAEIGAMPERGKAGVVSLLGGIGRMAAVWAAERPGMSLQGEELYVSAGAGSRIDLTQGIDLATANQLAIPRSGRLSDFVVEEGESGAWAWEKRASGAAAAWGTVDVEFSNPLNYMGEPFVDGPTVRFPFAFASRPKVLATASADRGLYYASLTDVTASSTGFYLRGVCDYATATVHVDLLLLGRWK